MSNELAIRVQDISKAYTIWSSPAARLHGPLLGQVGQLPFLPSPVRKLCKRLSHESFRNFYALRGISFDVGQGESIGIVGRNGSGKSTLLQIVAGTLQPTTGSVEVRGRVAALLELGSGFNPEFTGRENVYLNGAVLGLTRKEIDQRIGEIEAFADIGEFVDQPVKTYSSGMVVRLAFSVAACVSPEVLVIDEALAVGDIGFQQKCLNRIEEAKRRGTTILFVSHDFHMVRNYCDRAIYLKAGQMVMQGDTEAVTEAYLKDIVAERQASAAMGLEWKSNRDIGTGGFGGGAGEVTSVEFVSRDRGPGITAVSYGDEIGLKITARVERRIRNPNLLCQLRDFRGYLICGVTSARLGIKFPESERADDTVSATFWWPVALKSGQYSFTVGLNDHEGPALDTVIDRVFGVSPFTVLDNDDPFHGTVDLKVRCEKALSPQMAGAAHSG